MPSSMICTCHYMTPGSKMWAWGATWTGDISGGLSGFLQPGNPQECLLHPSLYGELPSFLLMTMVVLKGAYPSESNDTWSHTAWRHGRADPSGSLVCFEFTVTFHFPEQSQGCFARKHKLQAPLPIAKGELRIDAQPRREWGQRSKMRALS